MSEEQEVQETKQPEKTFFKDLVDRRVPQIMGMYLGGSAGMIQFLDWLTNRYLLSPYLVELALVILASLLPSALVVAYCHGAPGRNKWPLSERVTVPVNLILCVALCFSFFGDKELASIAKKVTVKDATGKTTERIVPKSSFRKKVALFYFDNTSGDSSLDWLQYGIIHMLGLDLTQDIFIETRSPHYPGLDSKYSFYNQLKTAGYQTCLKVPLLLKKKVAQENQRDTFLSGEISKQGENLRVVYTLYRSKDAKKLAVQTFEGKELFEMVDDMSVRLKEDLDIPAGHLDNVNDLPLGEIFTRSVPAARLYTRSQNAVLFERNYDKALELLEQALKDNPDFVTARLQSAALYTANNQLDKAKAAFEDSFKLFYKVPEGQQYVIKAVYNGLQGRVAEGASLLEMHLKLYPEDASAYSLLVAFYTGLNRPADILRAYRKILEIDPKQYKLYRSMGKVYEAMDQDEEALKHYQTAAQHLPNSAESFTAIGALHEKKGNFKRARESYEKALLINPGDIEVLVTLATVEYKCGRFDQALKQYGEALEKCRSSKDKTNVYGALEDFHSLRGQMKKSLEYVELQLESMAPDTLPLLMMTLKIPLAINCAQAGLEARALSILKDLEKQLKPPFDRNIPRGYMEVYLNLGRPGDAETYVQKMESMMGDPQMAPMQFFIDKGRAKILEMRGQYSEAMDRYQKALKVLPTSRKFQCAIARCQRKLKRFDDAEELLTGILSKSPFHPTYNLEAALLYLDMENKEKARHHLKRALEAWKNADPEYAPAQEAKKTMAALEE